MTRQRDHHEKQMSDRDCVLCHIPIRMHPRCSACGILVGSAHYEKALYLIDGARRCNDCAKRGKGE
jgi:hypothetical protein